MTLLSYLKKFNEFIEKKVEPMDINIWQRILNDRERKTSRMVDFYSEQGILGSFEAPPDIKDQELFDGWVVERVSDFLSVPSNRIIIKNFYFYYTFNGVDRFVLVVLLSPSDDVCELAQSLGITQIEPLNIKCSPNAAIKFNYTALSTIMDLKQHMGEQYNVPVAMQQIYRHEKMIADTKMKIVDLIAFKDAVELGRDICYDVSFVVRPYKSCTGHDDNYRTCLDNNITILETITLLFLTGKTFEVIHLCENERWENLNGVVEYIYQNIYKGKFQLYNQGGSSPLLYHRPLEDLFLESHEQYFKNNLNLIFVPDLQSRFKDQIFLDRYRTDMSKTVRLMFITKEEIVQVNGYLKVTALKEIVERKFKIPQHQLKFFHNKKELKDEAFLTELYMKQHDDSFDEEEEELIINVLVSKARTINIQVNCQFRLKSKDVSSAFILNVEDNMIAKDLLEMIQNRIKYGYPLAMDVNGITIHYKSKNNDKMLYEFLPRLSMTSLVASIFKFVKIILKIRMFEDDENTFVEDEECYVVTSRKETVYQMISYFERNKLNEFELDKVESNVTNETFLVSLYSGTVIHLIEKQKEEIIKKGNKNLLRRFICLG